MRLLKWKPWIVLLAILLLGGGCAGVFSPVEDTDATTTSTATTTTTVKRAEYKDLLLSLGVVTGGEGETVELPLSVSAEGYLVNADLVLRYDPTLLKPVVDEDGSCATADQWSGGLWSAEVEAGCVKLMLATAGDGTREAQKLCTVRFKVLAAETATVTLEAAAVGSCQPGDAGADVLAAELVQLADGTVN